jgi:hypothetical protein
MSTYTPDKWVMLKITGNDQPVYKVLAGWTGGYLHGDSWKLNSGVVSVEEHDDHYAFAGASGSVYVCRKNSYGLTMMTSQILKHFTDQAPSVNIEMLSEDANFNELKYE